MSLLEVEGLSKQFPVRGGLFRRGARAVHAVEDVSFTLARGETLGLVGESGSGKSTVARCVARLIDPSGGSILIENEDVAALKDVNKRELVFLALLAACVLAMGIYPKPFSDVMNPSVTELLNHVGQSKIR